jgi:hypothetical protein
MRDKRFRGLFCVLAFIVVFLLVWLIFPKSMYAVSADLIMPTVARFWGEPYPDLGGTFWQNYLHKWCVDTYGEVALPLRVGAKFQIDDFRFEVLEISRYRGSREVDFGVAFREGEPYKDLTYQFAFYVTRFSGQKYAGVFQLVWEVFDSPIIRRFYYRVGEDGEFFYITSPYDVTPGWSN